MTTPQPGTCFGAYTIQSALSEGWARCIARAMPKSRVSERATNQNSDEFLDGFPKPYLPASSDLF